MPGTAGLRVVRLTSLTSRPASVPVVRCRKMHQGRARCPLLDMIITPLLLHSTPPYLPPTYRRTAPRLARIIISDYTRAAAGAPRTGHTDSPRDGHTYLTCCTSIPFPFSSLYLLQSIFIERSLSFFARTGYECVMRPCGPGRCQDKGILDTVAVARTAYKVGPARRASRCLTGSLSWPVRVAVPVVCCRRRRR